MENEISDVIVDEYGETVLAVWNYGGRIYFESWNESGDCVIRTLTNENAKALALALAKHITIVSGNLVEG